MLRFGLFGIPIRIHASFLLLAFFGWSAGFTGTEVAVWTLAVLIAVLVHEFGHALTARGFGSSVAITIYALGGLTHWKPAAPLSPVRRLLVYGAGSGAGFLLGGLVWWLGRSGALGVDVAFSLDQAFPVQIAAARFTGNPAALAAAVLVWVSVVWGLANWLPLRSLDGGHMMETLLERVIPARAATVAAVISAITGVGAAFFAWRAGWFFAALFALYLGFSGITARRPRPPIPAREAGTDQPFPI
jgi:membrane-associated protease RseP (regulator of RpoE activity)